MQPMNRESIRDAVESLRDQGRVYIKAHHVADVLGKDATKGQKTHISQELVEMDDVVKWGKSKNLTFRLTDGEQA